MQLVAEIIPREAYTADAYSGALYPTSSRAHLALIAEAENVREVKLHLEAWDVASESYFAVWEEPTPDSAIGSRSYVLTEQAILFPPDGWERVLLTPRMRVRVELLATGSPAAAVVRLEWSDALSGSADAEV